MKIRYGTLKLMLREIALSPSVFKTQATHDPMSRKGIAKAMAELRSSFQSGLVTDLVLNHSDKYDDSTKEFDDAAWQELNEIATSTTEHVMAEVSHIITDSWQGALGSDKKAKAA